MRCTSAIAAPGSWVWKYGVFANLTPGHQETWVDYRRDDRAPLLFIAGGADHIMPPAVNKSNAKKYRHHGFNQRSYQSRLRWRRSRR